MRLIVCVAKITSVQWNSVRYFSAFDCHLQDNAIGKNVLWNSFAFEINRKRNQTQRQKERNRTEARKTQLEYFM